MRLKFWAGIAVSVGLLAFLFFGRVDFHVLGVHVHYSGIDFPRLWATIKEVNPWYLAAAALLNLAFYVVRSVRWRYLMDPVKPRIPVGSLFSATMIGFMANNVLPARLGEFVRAYALGKREDVAMGSTFATIVVVRLFDGMSVLLLMIVSLATLPSSIASGPAAATIKKAGTLSLVAYLGVIVFLGYFLYRPHIFSNGVRAVLKPVSEGLAEKAAYMADSFMLGLGVVKQARLLLPILFYNALHWGFLWIPTYLLFRAFGMGYGVYASVFILVVTCFSVGLPSTPGYVGTLHAAVAGGMILLGQDASTALSFAILVHAVGYIPVTLIGLYCLYRENLSFKGISRLEATQQT